MTNNFTCLHCGAPTVGFHFGPRCPNDCEEKQFQRWFENWRGVFANEIQAKQAFKEAQPKREQ